MTWYWWQFPLFSLIPSKKNSFWTKNKFIICRVVSTERRGKYKKYFSFTWSTVLAVHDRKTLVRALQSSGKLLAVESYPYPKSSILHQILPFPSQCADNDFRWKSLCHDNQKPSRICAKACWNVSIVCFFPFGQLYDIFSNFCTWQLHLLKVIKNVQKKDRLVISSIV